MSGAVGEQTILVTGASGYLGYATASALAAAGKCVRFGARGPEQARDTGHTWSYYGDLALGRDLDPVLEGCDCVIHFAGLAHVPEGPDAEQRARKVNVEGTARLVEAAIDRGVRRFVFVSSAHVNGSSSGARPFKEDDEPQPDNVYARSKLEAERELKAIAVGSKLEWAIVRPPMVYGWRAPGNFGRLVKLVRTGMPLPLGAAQAGKSFIHVDNLVSAVTAITEHPQAANKTFLVSDREVTSTAEMLQLIAVGLDKKVLLVSVPQRLLSLGARLLGREKVIRRLFDPLEIDTRYIRDTLGWSAPVPLAEAVRRAVQPA